jgi:RNA polymerase sigma factor (sigma-70 family)
MDNPNDPKPISQRVSQPVNEPSDETLIHAIAGGAVWAMEPLYQRYSRIFYSLAYRMVADHHIAEDLVQDAFLSVWRRAISYSPQSGAVRGWLISIVHHRAIDYLRNVRRRSALKTATLEDVDVDEYAIFPDVWDEVWHSVQSTQIRAALMNIPTEQRMVIELAYFQGWTHTEIAEGCQIPLGTVKARLRLGLMHLKKTLETMGVNDET